MRVSCKSHDFILFFYINLNFHRPEEVSKPFFSNCMNLSVTENNDSILIIDVYEFVWTFS